MLETLCLCVWHRSRPNRYSRCVYAKEDGRVWCHKYRLLSAFTLEESSILTMGASRTKAYWLSPEAKRVLNSVYESVFVYSVISLVHCDWWDGHEQQVVLDVLCVIVVGGKATLPHMDVCDTFYWIAFNYVIPLLSLCVLYCRYAEEISIINQQHPAETFKFLDPPWVA